MSRAFPVIAFAAFAFSAFAQDAELPAPAPDPHPVPSYWRLLLEGGPYFMALHALLAVAFVLAVVAALRRASPAASVALCFLPFVFGASALWLGLGGWTAIATAPMHEGDIVGRLYALPRPFYLGTAASTLAFLTLGVFHALNRNA